MLWRNSSRWHFSKKEQLQEQSLSAVLEGKTWSGHWTHPELNLPFALAAPTGCIWQSASWMCWKNLIIIQNLPNACWFLYCQFLCKSHCTCLSLWLSDLTLRSWFRQASRGHAELRMCGMGTHDFGHAVYSFMCLIATLSPVYFHLLLIIHFPDCGTVHKGS